MTSCLRRNLPLGFLLVLVVPVSLFALPQSDRSSAGSDAFDAVAEFVALAGSEDVSGEDWFALAQRSRESGDMQTAGRALDQAATTLPAPRIGLERARIRVAEDRREDAVAVLSALAADGFAQVRLVTDDPVLGSLVGVDGYDEAVESMRQTAYPCLYDDLFRQFDFWVGEWTVHQPNGQMAGTNTIRSEQAGCVLTESWTSVFGNTGTSINYPDKTTGEWVQVWNSENGAQINIRGGMTPDGMLLEGHIHNVASGTTAPFRGLWTPLDDGRVRQYFEQSGDGGKTWSPWFEGYYTRESDPDNE